MIAATGSRNRRKGDESHLRSFFLYASCVRASGDAPSVQKELFADVPELCATDITAMRRTLYQLFISDERRFCKQMIYFITSIRKRNRGCEGQAFPPDTLHHKLRRLSGAGSKRQHPAWSVLRVTLAAACMQCS